MLKLKFVKFGSIIIAMAIAMIGLSSSFTPRAHARIITDQPCDALDGSMTCVIHQEFSSACSSYGMSGYVAVVMPGSGRMSYVGFFPQWYPPYSPIAWYEIHTCMYKYEVPAFAAAIQNFWASFDAERADITTVEVQQRLMLNIFQDTYFGSTHRVFFVGLKTLTPHGQPFNNIGHIEEWPEWVN